MSTTRTAIAGASVGLLAAGAESLRPSLTPRSTLHQGLVTGLMGLTGAAAGGVVGRAIAGVGGPTTGVWAPGAVVLATAGAAALQGRRHVQAQRESHAEWGADAGHPALAAGAGATAAAGLAAGAVALGTEVGSAGTGLSRRAPGSARTWTVATAAAAAGVSAVGVKAALHKVLSGIAASGRALDTALRNPTSDPYVSGGPGSLVRWLDLSREGARFVSWRVSADDLRAAGVAQPQESRRVFVGVASGAGVAERVDLAVTELDRLDAWSTSAILAVSPAGTGYANSVPVEALELLTAGDCASVSVQYGVLPSMFSLNKMDLAAETFRLLIDAIQERIAQLPDGRRPKLFLYGESLGAAAAQHGLSREPALVDLATAQVRGVDAALFVGTPGGDSLRDDLLHHPRTVHVDQWQALPDRLPTDVSLWFLEHDADPVTRFDRRLLTRRPAWLVQEPRGRNIPADMTWLPVVTWQQVLLDVAYATQAQSGVFRSVGHDYRADLAPVAAAAWAPEHMGAVPHIQEVLAARELERDRLLAAAEGSDSVDAADAPTATPG